MNPYPTKEYVYYDIINNELFIHWSFFLEQIYDDNFIFLGEL